MDKSLPETNKTAKYQSLDFWDNCLNEYRNKFSGQRKKYFHLLKKYPDNLHQKIKNLFQMKLKSFEQEYKKSGAISTRLLNDENKNSGAISTPPKQTPKNKSGANSTYVKMESALPDNICIVTGLEIKYPAKGKKFLKHPDIKFYYEKDRETYSEKLESLLTDKWKRKHEAEPIKDWFVEIAHKIRCAKSNPRRNPINNTRNSFRRLEEKGLKLWPTEQIADPAKLELIDCNYE